MRRVTVSLLLVVGLCNSWGTPVVLGQPAQWRAYTDGGWMACRDGKYNKAVELLEQALKSAPFPADDPRIALTNSYLAYTLFRCGKPIEAEQCAKKALAVYQELQEKLPDTPKGLNALALLRQSQKQFVAAEMLYKKAQAVEESVHGPTHSAVAQLLVNRASLYEWQGRYEEAELLLKRAVTILFRDEKTGRGRLAKTLIQLGSIYRRWGRPKDAEPYLVSAVDARRQLPGKNNLELATALNALGTLSFELRKNEQAERLLKEALEIRERALKPLDPPQQLDLALSLHNLGIFYLGQKRYIAAEPLLQKALVIRKAALPASDSRTAATLHNLGLVHLGRQEYGPAENCLKEAIATKEKAEGQYHIDIAASTEALGYVYLALGPKFLVQAENNFRRALFLREKALGPDNPAVVASLVVVANFYRDVKRSSDAEPLYRRALTIYEKQGSEQPEVATVLEQYVILLKQTGKLSQADETASRAKAIRSKTGSAKEGAQAGP